MLPKFLPDVPFGAWETQSKDLAERPGHGRFTTLKGETWFRCCSRSYQS